MTDFSFPWLGVLFLWDLIRVFHRNLTISGFCDGIHDSYLYLASTYKPQQVLLKREVLVFLDQIGRKMKFR